MGSSNGTSGVPIGTTTRGAVRPDHQNIHFTSKKEIGTFIIYTPTLIYSRSMSRKSNAMTF